MEGKRERHIERVREETETEREKHTGKREGEKMEREGEKRLREKTQGGKEREIERHSEKERVRDGEIERE